MTGDEHPLFEIPPGVQHLMNADDSPMVLAYRMGEVEKISKEILARFDKFAELYVNHASLVLVLEPIKSNVKELQENEKDRINKKDSQTSQFRLAMAIAIASPLFNLIIILLLGSKTK